MKFIPRSGLFLLLGLLAACVTINVYFPAADAEKAADLIINQVYKGKPQAEEKPPQTPETPPASAPTNPSKPSATPASEQPSSLLQLRHWAQAITLIPAVHAQADFNISTPRVQALQAQMTQRHGQLQPHYTSGAVGIKADGMLTVRDMNLVPLPARNKVQSLVSEENQDRNELYREIADANGHPEWESEIRRVFSSRWVDKALPGWWYQANGQWQQK